MPQPLTVYPRISGASDDRAMQIRAIELLRDLHYTLARSQINIAKSMRVWDKSIGVVDSF